jgi:hypothetical protein
MKNYVDRQERVGGSEETNAGGFARSLNHCKKSPPAEGTSNHLGRRELAFSQSEFSRGRIASRRSRSVLRFPPYFLFLHAFHPGMAQHDFRVVAGAGVGEHHSVDVVREMIERAA